MIVWKLKNKNAANLLKNFKNINFNLKDNSDCNIFDYKKENNIIKSF